MTSSIRRRALGAAGGLALGAGLLTAVAAPPAAAQDLPTFSFADCPKLPEGAVPEFWLCSVAITYGGTFQLGSINQTITSPITITYANGFDPVTGESQVLFGGLKANRFLVQPGLFGDPFVSAVYAQPKYAGSFNLDGGKIQLSLKVNVQNPLLGSNCHIGTNSNAIKLNLGVTATNPPPPNTPIQGEPPVLVSEDPPVIKTTVVDNAFAVPRSSGCGFGLGPLNWAVDKYAGLPSAAGRNTAIFKQYVSNRTYTDIPAR
ncbi:hypothetical protein ACFVH6_01845 [Spirillospora sp. NPDC127200]